MRANLLLAGQDDGIRQAGPDRPEGTAPDTAVTSVEGPLRPATSLVKRVRKANHAESEAGCMAISSIGNPGSSSRRKRVQRFGKAFTRAR
jgi:hypothetical protein